MYATYIDYQPISTYVTNKCVFWNFNQKSLIWSNSTASTPG